ncbi:MAG: type II toxin-antitoxin system HicA family toxin [Ignavibacterium album]|uniref:type II toxin-antitoxin system HicA family toxin n=1 Tax=Ignavibacterium album TaxID=591197 RepID=UPI0026ED8D93|nr:type II toxin-antitoxin system HicA family toxin [Ignavibacterium album]MCX8105970.1 type II toxin-antitoxin system HicA family toxin [Ignavibacterium album]
MPKLYSSQEIERVLLKEGFEFKKQKGSHGKFKHLDGRIVILPMNKKEIPEGTFRSILKQIGISKEDFEKK